MAVGLFPVWIAEHTFGRGGWDYDYLELTPIRLLHSRFPGRFNWLCSHTSRRPTKCLCRMDSLDIEAGPLKSPASGNKDLRAWLRFETGGPGDLGCSWAGLACHAG